MFALKVKFILLPQLTATLNNCACSLPPLIMWTGLLSLNAFCQPCINPRLVKWRQRRAPSWLWGPDMAPTVSARLSRPCSGILALALWVHVHVIATLLSSLIIKLLPPLTPPPHPPPPPPTP